MKNHIIFLFLNRDIDEYHKISFMNKSDWRIKTLLFGCGRSVSNLTFRGRVIAWYEPCCDNWLYITPKEKYRDNKYMQNKIIEVERMAKKMLLLPNPHI